MATFTNIIFNKALIAHTDEQYILIMVFACSDETALEHILRVLLEQPPISPLDTTIPTILLHRTVSLKPELLVT